MKSKEFEDLGNIHKERMRSPNSEDFTRFQELWTEAIQIEKLLKKPFFKCRNEIERIIEENKLLKIELETLKAKAIAKEKELNISLKKL